MANGVHGIIDLTVPAGGSSLSVSVGKDGEETVPRRDFGSMKRILYKTEISLYLTEVNHLTDL